MKSLVTHLFSISVFVLGFYVSSNVSGIERVFLMAGFIVASLIAGLIVQKLLDEFSDL